MQKTIITRMMEDVIEFHEKFGFIPYEGFDKTPQEYIEFRNGFLQEEAAETMQAMGNRNKVEALDGLIDLAYVAMGTVHMVYRPVSMPRYSIVDIGLLDIALLVDGHHIGPSSKQWLVDLSFACYKIATALGWDFIEGWNRVHAANMQKIRTERAEDSKRGSTFDVIKPPGWSAPSLYDLIS